jgi:hypothetical protein
MSDNARVHGKLSAANVMEFYDRSTYERVDVLTNIVFKDDFIGAGGGIIPAAGSPVDGFPWVKKLVDTHGSPTVGAVANAGGGQVQLLIDTTSEKQEATLYGNDSLWTDVTKGLIFEARVKLTTLPSATGVEAVWGVSSAWTDGPDNASEYVEFGISGAGGAINMRSQDGVTQNAVASGFTADTAFHVYRFDCYAPAAILFYVDGVLQNGTGGATIGFAATGSSAILQPYLSCYKPSGAGHAVMVVDYVRAWMTSREA